MSRTLDKFALNPDELEVLWQGLEDGVLGRPSKVDLSAEADRLLSLQETRRDRLRHQDREAGSQLIAAVATEQNVERRPSGLVIQPLVEGQGAKPTASDHVSVHYEGTLVDGTVFDSSRARGEPSTFPVRGVIACWTEALQLMRVGERSRIICPPQIAYGERGRPPVIRPDATLVFDIELLGIVR
jgi:FKBP-type peptidyl-prolyl cis-trans isomerase FkpA/FKBP-type peptidyl-prolyl cis-trans isomerase FklB